MAPTTWPHQEERPEAGKRTWLTQSEMTGSNRWEPKENWKLAMQHKEIFMDVVHEVASRADAIEKKYLGADN